LTNRNYRQRRREGSSGGGELRFHMVWLDLGGGAMVEGGKGGSVATRHRAAGGRRR